MRHDEDMWLCQNAIYTQFQPQDLTSLFTHIQDLFRNQDPRRRPAPFPRSRKQTRQQHANFVPNPVFLSGVKSCTDVGGSV